MYFSVVKHEGGKKMTLDIGEKIKTSRKEADFTQEDAANGIGISIPIIISIKPIKQKIPPNTKFTLCIELNIIAFVFYILNFSPRIKIHNIFKTCIFANHSGKFLISLIFRP